MAAKHLSGSVLVVLFLAKGTFAGLALAQDEIISPMRTGGKANCQPVHATTDERVIVDCPAGQVFDFCFTRKMVDQAGMITGQLEYFSDPSNAAKLEHAPGKFQYNGVVNYVTDSGVLHIEENGILDSESKDWSGLATIKGGTGEFEGATGKLATFGNTSGTGMSIGTICKQ